MCWKLLRSWIMVHLGKSISWNPLRHTDSHPCTRPPWIFRIHKSSDDSMKISDSQSLLLKSLNQQVEDHEAWWWELCTIFKARDPMRRLPSEGFLTESAQSTDPATVSQRRSQTDNLKQTISQVSNPKSMMLTNILTKYSSGRFGIIVPQPCAFNSGVDMPRWRISKFAKLRVMRRLMPWSRPRPSYLAPNSTQSSRVLDRSLAETSVNGFRLVVWRVLDIGESTWCTF